MDAPVSDARARIDAERLQARKEGARLLIRSIVDVAWWLGIVVVGVAIHAQITVAGTTQDGLIFYGLILLVAVRFTRRLLDPSVDLTE